MSIYQELSRCRYGLGVWGSIPDRGERFLSIPQPHILWVPRVISPGVKRSGCDGDHSFPSNADVKLDGAITPLPHTSSWRVASLIKHRESLTFLP
jgi:hypothetical protein